MHGSEIIKKDVLEYIVFEKHLSNEYGAWRIHGKIIPPWTPPRLPTMRTQILELEPEPEPEVKPAVQVAKIADIDSIKTPPSVTGTTKAPTTQTV